ncbi:unnamed protein product [Paramecium octaurelia]|uniref:Uncharacterized protein n=1 Tax=Paramecium octaurelia TaxID=43137 RepID=A0A8S1Y437_PAROT|nr:unnamed protein product [Paramecium octaurelia]
MHNLQLQLAWQTIIQPLGIMYSFSLYQYNVSFNLIKSWNNKPKFNFCEDMSFKIHKKQKFLSFSTAACFFF